jgi:hypothetical protein
MRPLEDHWEPLGAAAARVLRKVEQRRQEKPLTDEELHAKYAGANRRLREIYGTNEGKTEHAD